MVSLLIRHTRLFFTKHFLRAYLAGCHRPSPQLAGFLTVYLERRWSVHWCPELDGHLLRPAEAWVDIPMVAAAPPVRQDGPLPASALAYLEHPCLLCGTAENSVLCLAARLLGGPGGFAVDGWQLQNCCHVH